LNIEGKENSYKGRMGWLVKASVQKGERAIGVTHLGKWKKDVVLIHAPNSEQ